MFLEVEQYFCHLSSFEFGFGNHLFEYVSFVVSRACVLINPVHLTLWLEIKGFTYEIYEHSF